MNGSVPFIEICKNRKTKEKTEILLPGNNGKKNENDGETRRNTSRENPKLNSNVQIP